MATAEHGRERADMGLVLDEIGRDVQPRARRDDGRDDQHLAVAPDELAVAVRVQHLRRRQDVIDPPHAEREPDAGDADQRRIQRPALFLDDGRQRRDRAHDALAQRDDREQAVALGNVVRVPGRAAVPALGDDGPRQLDEREDADRG